MALNGTNNKDIMNKSKLNCSMLIDPKLLLGNYVRETITSYYVCNILPSSLEPLVKDKRETIYFIHLYI